MSFRGDDRRVVLVHKLPWNLDERHYSTTVDVAAAAHEWALTQEERADRRATGRHHNTSGTHGK